MADFSAEIVDFGAEQAKRGQGVPPAGPLAGTLEPQNAAPATAAPSPAAGPFDDAISSFGQSQHMAATGHIIGAVGGSPDAAGKALTLAPQVGTPPGVVEGDLPAFEARHQVAKNAAIAGANPRMADWLARDPMHARVSMDDFEHLNTLSKITTALGSGYQAALLSNQRGRLGTEAALGASNEPQIAKVERDLATHPQLSGIYGKLQDLAGFAGGMLDNWSKGAFTGVQGASVGLVGGGAAGSAAGGVGVVPGAAAGSLAGFGVGFGVGWKYDAARIAAGNTYLNLSQIEGENGQKISPIVKDVTSVAVGLTNYALLGLGEKTVAKPITQLLSDGVAKAVTKPTVARALTTFGMGLVKSGAQGAALNTAMEATNIIGEELAKQLSGGQNFDTVFNDPIQRQQAVDQIATSFENGAMLFPIIHAAMPFKGGGIHDFVTDTMRARQAANDVATFQGLESGAAENKTRTRSMSAFRSFMEAQTGGTPVENLGISGEAMRTLYQSAGVEPGPGDGLLGDVVPNLKEQMSQASTTGGDIVVPTAAYVAHLAGTPISESLRADIRFRPDGMTMREAEAYEKERGTHLADLATQGQASLDAAAIEAEPGRQVYADIFSKLRAAGQTNDAASQYAALVASRYEARAERFGGAKGTAADIYRAENIDVRRGEATDDKATTGRVLEQPDLFKFEAGDFADNPPRPLDSADVDRNRLIVTMKAPDGEIRYGKPGDIHSDLIDTEAGEGLTKDGWEAGFAEGPGKPFMSRDEAREFITKNYAQGERGRIDLRDGAATITLFKDADLSTFLHETGHQWLDEMSRDAFDVDAPETLKADAATIAKWLGADDFSTLSTEQHEQFARGFESYLMEGRAPSSALASAFRKFKSWLLRIYKSAAALRVPMNDEIRGVFDRMIASDDAINSWRAAEGLRPVFATAKDAGMTDAEFSAYSKAIDKARNSADEKMLVKTMESVRRQRTAEWKAEAATVREEVAPEIKARKDLKAQYFLRTGKMLDDPEAVPSVEKVRLSREALDDMYGTDEASKALPFGIITAKGGAHPDEVADLFGYRSGDELVRALMSLEASRKQAEEATGEKLDGQKYVRKMIDDEVQRRMFERHGDPLNDGSIEEEALAAVHNSAQADVMAMETRAIARQAGTTALTLRDINIWADGQIAEMNVERGTDVRQFARQEAKAGREVERALLKGDHAAAFEAKQRQLINHVLTTKAKEAAEDYEAAQKLFSRYAGKPTFKSMEQEYTDRIHEILKRIGYSTKRSDEELAGGIKSSLAEFVAEKLSMGEEFVMADFLLDPAWRKDAVSSMTTDEMRNVADTVKSLAHVARSLHSVLDEGKRQELAELVQEATDKMSTMKQKDIPAEINPGTGPGIQGVLQRLSSLMRKADSALLKQEQVFDWLDGRDPNGVFNRVVFRRLKDAQHRENDMLAEATDKVRKIGAAMSKEWTRTLDNRVAVSELTDQRTGKAFIFRRKDLLALALNIGNEGNFEKLSRGYGWDRDTIKHVLDTHLKKEDWDFVQGIWDTFESLYPDIEAMTRRVTGVGPEKVVATPVDTIHGQYRGGYYPVVYDPLKSHREELRSQKAGADMFENNYFRATTPKGHTLARTDYSAPIRLSLDIIPWKLGQAVHDLSFREAVIDADKFLTQRGIREGVDGVLGHEYTQQFRKWLQSIANDRNIDDKGLAGMDWLARQARINTTVVGIGFRISTMLKHGTTALSNSVGEVGGKWMLRGAREVYGSPSQMRVKWDYATSRSGELRHRMNSIDRDVREGLRTLQGQTGIIAAAERYSHYGVAMLDMGSAVPTWYAGYRKALSEGASDADAVYAGDKAVRNAHGAQGVTDIAQIQRGGEVAKLFTMFYGFFNHIYNRQRDTVRVAGEGVEKVKGGDYAGARRDFAMVLARSMYYVMVPAFVEAMVSEGAPHEDKDETWGGWAGKAILGEIPAGIPLVRDIAKAAISGHDYAMSPVAHAVTTSLGTGKDIGAFLGLREDKEPSKRWLQHAIDTTGYVFGLPTGQIAGTTQYLWDVLDGDEQPEDTQDFVRGLMYGPKKGH